MNEHDLEQGLRERGRRLAQEPLLSERARAEVLGEMRVDARAERRGRWIAPLAGLAAALVLSWFLGVPRAARAPAEVEVALLDGRGRELFRRTRSEVQEPVRAEVVLIELVGVDADAFVSVDVYGPDGARRSLGTTRIDPDQERTLEWSPSGAAAETPGPVTIFVLSADRALPPAAGIALPDRLPLEPAERAAEVERIRRELARDLSCAVRVHAFSWAPR